MHLFQSLLSLISSVTFILAVPSPRGSHFVPITRRDETTAIRPKGYIVKLKPEAAFVPTNAVNSLDSATDDETTILHEYPELKAFAGVFSPAALEVLQRNPDVELIEEDAVGGIDTIVQQTNAPWGVQRISSCTKINSNASTALSYTYTYDELAGTGVDIYVVDTGTTVVKISTFEVDTPKQVLILTIPSSREGQFGERCVSFWRKSFGES